MTNLDSILKSRDITLPTKVHLVKAMVFPVVMYGYESWTIKKAECWRIDAFELWCRKRRLRVPLDCKIKPVNPKGNLKEINPEYSLEGLLLKLKLQYFSHQMQRADSLEKTDAGKDWRQKEKRAAEDEMVGMASLIQWTCTWVNSGRQWGTGRPGALPGCPWVCKELDTTEQLNNNNFSF